MPYFATFNEDGFVSGFYHDDFNPSIPDDAIKLTDAQYLDLLENQGVRRLVGGQIVSYTPPSAEVVTIIPAVTLWERMTDVEAEQVNAAMATQPFRTRQIFLTANTFRSDHELWPLLVQMATDLFGEERMKQIIYG